MLYRTVRTEVLLGTALVWSGVGLRSRCAAATVTPSLPDASSGTSSVTLWLWCGPICQSIFLNVCSLPACMPPQELLPSFVGRAPSPLLSTTCGVFPPVPSGPRVIFFFLLFSCRLKLPHPLWGAWGRVWMVFTVAVFPSPNWNACPPMPLGQFCYLLAPNRWRLLFPGKVGKMLPGGLREAALGASSVLHQYPCHHLRRLLEKKFYANVEPTLDMQLSGI